ARGSRLAMPRLFASPTFYGICKEAGGGRTLPFATFAQRGTWYGGLSLAVQEVDPSRIPTSSNNVVFGPPPPPGVVGVAVPNAELFWDPSTQRALQRQRLDRELERTETWGLHLQYERPLAASGWRVGWIATGNLMSHPKIPDYEIMSIPRDPGHSHAYQLGIGVARINGPAMFGLDAVYEPIWSHTYATAAVPAETARGDTIPVGGTTIENRFRFSNALFRMGVGRELPIGSRPRAAAWQLGIAVHAIHDWLRQEH